MKELGFIGFGNFGRFILPHLQPFFKIRVYDLEDYSQEAIEMGYSWGTLKEVASREIVVLGVPVQYLEKVLLDIKDVVAENALIIDISSVKVKPLQLMQKHLPSTVDIVGTHPLFGPQSGKHGINGLNLVVCPVRYKKVKSMVKFFSKVLHLNVLERTAIIHDQQMAYVQALTHFIGRAVNEMDIPDVEQKTPAYQSLLDIKRNLGRDSMDLFLTIEKENPYARSVREQFIEELNLLNQNLE
jgi:prephenate dehydrogenase